MTLRTLNFENYGIFLIMGSAGFCPSTVCLLSFVLWVSVCKGSSKEAFGFMVLGVACGAFTADLNH